VKVKWEGFKKIKKKKRGKKEGKQANNNNGV
jgi:hypothetical protein